MVHDACEVVTKAHAATMPQAYNVMSNEAIIIMSHQGDRGAKAERLVRNIMVVDDCEWAEGNKKLHEIHSYNQQGVAFLKLPYYFGITASVSAAFASIPLVFDLNTALWFNEAFVTTDGKYSVNFN